MISQFFSKLSPLQKKILSWVGVFAFYLFCLFVFFRLLFPYEALRERLVTEFNQSQTDRRIEIDELSGYWLFGLEAEGVRLISLDSKPSQAKDQAGPNPPAPTIELDSVQVSVSLLSYLFGTLSVSYSADLGGGELFGVFKQSETEAFLRVKGEDIDTTSLSILSNLIGLPLGGVLSFQMELTLPEKKMQQAEGNFDLQISDLSIGDGQAKVRNTIALPRISAGDLQIKAEIVTGRMELKEFSTNGSDLEVSADGKLRLRDPIDKSAADINLAFRFKEAYTNKSDLTKSIFGSPDGKIPGLFDMDPQVRQAKGEDGLYRWRVTGMLSYPSFRPGAKSTAAASTSKKN